MSVSHISRRFLASRIVSLHTTCCVGFTKNINFQYPRVIDVNRVRYFYTHTHTKKEEEENCTLRNELVYEFDLITPIKAGISYVI